MIKTAPQDTMPKTKGGRSPVMERRALVREYETYKEFGPAKISPFIRKLHDVVGKWEMIDDERGRCAGFDESSQDPPCLVLEWMDDVLWNLRPKPHRDGKSILPKIIARSILQALHVLASANAMPTSELPLSALLCCRRRFSVVLVVLTRPDVTPHNISLSNINTASPMVKLGNLENCK